MAAGSRLNQTTAARAKESWEWTTERNALEAAQIETASPLIETFVTEMRKEHDRVGREPNPQTTELQVNQNTGNRVSVPVKGKVVRVQDRLAAINGAIDAALALRLQPDQSNIAQKLDELRAGLPKVGIFNE